MSAALKRVTRRDPCPVCNHPGWCSVTDDGCRAICMRESSGSVKETANGGYLHILRERDDWQPSALRPKVEVQAQKERAGIARRHSAYTALLGRLTLSRSHADALDLQRGLGDVTIAANLYATTPDERSAERLVTGLAEHHDLALVPGFYRSGAGWRLSLRNQGLLIPVRDAQWRIQGCQIRHDDGEPRYVWLSSIGRREGASPGAPAHFARPWRIRATGFAIVTEGALKGDVIAERLDAGVVALAGVSSFRPEFGGNLRAAVPELRRVAVAFDADFRTKSEVRAALKRLLRSLTEAGLHATVWTWPLSQGKGLDDALLAGSEVPR